VNQRLISQIGKSQRLHIIIELKRSTGLSVRELSRRLKMSYMGVKQHCVDLEKERYVDTWRRPKGVGRPEIVYRLTMRANELFPQTSNAMTIELLHSAHALYGPAAAEKLLFTVFQKKTEDYAAKLKGGTLAARAKSLAKLRDTDGYMSNYLEDGHPRIVEWHTPLLDLLREFPILERLESDMIQRLLRTIVRREEQSAGGLYECTFYLG
jgi:predicted ArsR family transcriptional regulator